MMKLYKNNIQFNYPLFLLGFIGFFSVDVLCQKPIYLDATKSVELRVKDLMSKMTLEDKVAQMTQFVGLEHMKEAEKKLSVQEMKSSDAQGFYVGLFSQDVARMVTEGKIGSFLHVVTAEEANLLQELAQKTKLKIPLLIGIDAIHGNGLVRGTTTYPSPLSLAATWDDQLQYKIGRQTAVEMRATGSHWAFTPNIDVLRDPRWGRTGETYGEDPYLVGNMGVNTIKGLQGEGVQGNDKVIACAKHLIAGSESINGLNAAPTDISHRTLMEIYLPPYKRAIQEANVFSIMAAHNEINGIPCHADKFMMTDLLRNEWGFNGFYVSDWNDISRIAEWHHVAKDFNEATLMSVSAGMDMNMHGPLFADYVIDGVKNKKLNIDRIDQACAKILEAKFRLGLFENPMVDLSKVKSKLRSAEHLATSLEASRKCITLLKNNGALPLSKEDKKSIFITGPNADNMTTLGDWVAPQPEENFITVKEGIVTLGEKYGYTVSFFDPGQRSKLMNDADLDKAKRLSEDADIHILVLGENSFRHDWPNKTTGENIDRSSFTLSGKQLKLAQAIKKQGKKCIVVYISGSPIAEPWIEENADAIIYGWEGGDYAGQAIAEAIFGDLNPGGKCPVTIPRSVGQIQMVYNHKPTTYRHKYHSEKKTPLYVFGHGLSYTSYTYNNLKVIGTLQSANDELTVSVDVTNTGKMAGEEIAQLYIRDEKSQVTRPVMELKGYQRVALNPGETKSIQFKIKPHHLAYYSMEYDWIMEAGNFQIMVGGNSDLPSLKKTNYTVEQTIKL